MSDISLRTRLRPLRRRWWLLGSIAGAVWAVFAGLLLLLLGGWLDLVWELSPQGRIALWIAAALLAGAFFLLALVRIAQGGRFPLLARRVDRVMGFGGAVLTGYELDHPESKNSTSGTLSPAVSEALARMAVEHASTLAATTDVSRVLPTRRTGRPIFATLILLGLLALLALLMPEMMRTQWMRFLSPYSDIPRFSNTTIEIEDPEKQVVYGDALDIRAAVRGEPVDSVLLLLDI